jgi:glycerol kinase
MDLATLQWHQPFVELFKMTPAMLPRIVSNAEVYGHVAAGPMQGVPISGSLGDQMAAMLGPPPQRRSLPACSPCIALLAIAIADLHPHMLM